LLDIWMPDTDGISLLQEWSSSGSHDTPVIMMSGHGTVETAVEATRLGAFDFIEKPLSMSKLLQTVKRALEAASGPSLPPSEPRREIKPLADPIGRSQIMQNLREKAVRIAQHSAPVLISGEAGSGRSVFARFIHDQSTRKSGPFVTVTAAGLGKGATAELFGREKGERISVGAIERARGGTLYLKGVSDLDPETQLRLVGLLQQDKYLRLDGTRMQQADIRIIVSTGPDPSRAVSLGRLRNDLFFALNVLPLEVPPLREHVEDIPELVDHYLDRLVTEQNLAYRRFTVAAQNRLRNHGWPGNVRELVNLLQRLLILGSESEVQIPEIDEALTEAVQLQDGGGVIGIDLPLKEAREQFERQYLEEQIRREGGNISRVAHRIGLERTHLYRKLKSLNIDPKQITGG
ncbi:MAG: sigma-54-dependent Fis family transcriptional regulator, partial [Gammaproteobacteria bacterium]|nr:sigma-54-dependent Fis family transcriptional regulator [Gammaproteobacteria bacterium]